MTSFIFGECSVSIMNEHCVGSEGAFTGLAEANLNPGLMKIQAERTSRSSYIAILFYFRMIWRLLIVKKLFFIPGYYFKIKKIITG